MADTSARMLRLLTLLQTGRSWGGADLWSTRFTAAVGGSGPPGT